MDNRQTPNLAIDGEIMKKYIKRMLGGEVGTAHVDIVYDIVKRAMLDERQFALRMCDYHLNRAGLKKEFADFLMEVRNSIECGPTYSTIQNG